MRMNYFLGEKTCKCKFILLANRKRPEIDGRNYALRIVPFVFVILVLASFLSGCKENPGEKTLGQDFIESQTSITLIDTFSVDLSTVILDTIITSGTGNLLVGNYQDNIFGRISSRGYFQIGIPDSLEDIDVRDDDIYDSLSLIIKYNHYSFGDTTQPQRIQVHQLTENIKFNRDDIITGETSFNYDPNPIGSIVYISEPNNPIDTLTIRISDDIGFDLFTRLRDDSEILSNSEDFIDYFHGLVLVTDDAYDGAIVGFTASENDVRLILQTSRSGETAEKIHYTFGLEDPARQFNNITHDFSLTQLTPLVEQRNKLLDTEIGGLSYLQGGIGLAIRADFPSLSEILLFNRGAIVEARLSISPLRNSYKDFALPPQLSLYQSDKLNRINAPVLNNQGVAASSTLILDELYHEETSYFFDITSYLNDELADSYVDPEKGLIMTLPSANLKSSLYRLIADTENQNTKLNIYYLSY